MRVCSDCDQAAFSGSGVYCMALGEDIWNEEVAESCGLYENEHDKVDESSVLVTEAILPTDPGDAQIISLNGRANAGATPVGKAGVAPSNVGFDDQERVVTATVEVHYFGRLRHGEEVLETLRQLCEQAFSEVKVIS